MKNQQPTKDKQVDRQLTQNEQAQISTALIFGGGFIAVILIILQDIISMGAKDTPLFVAILAFAIALPFIAGPLFLYRMAREQEHFFENEKWYVKPSIYWWLGMVCAAIGIIASFWYVSWVAGLVSLIASLIMAVVIGYYSDLKKIVHKGESKVQRDSTRT